MTRLLLVIFLCFAAPWPAQAQIPPALYGQESKEIDELTVLSGGNSHRFGIELAISPQEQQKGLMNRRELPEDRGMLFIMPEEKMVKMWMKDTLIPLDMLFINRHGQVVSIAPQTPPMSLDVVDSTQPVKAVLELKGGTAEKLGITPGDTVLHPVFGQ